MRWPWQWFRSSHTVKMEGGDLDAFSEEVAKHLNALRLEGVDLSLVGDGVNQRNVFICHPALARAVSLISGVCASMVVNDLSVRDKKGQRVDNRRTDDLLTVLANSPDGGMTASLTFFEDVFSDYLLDGNGLFGRRYRGGSDKPTLKRYVSQSAYITRSNDDTYTYQARPAFFTIGDLEPVPLKEMVHVRWPMLRRSQGTSYQRDIFATSCVQLLNTQIRVSLKQDKYILEWYDKAPKPGVHVNYDPEVAKELGPKQKRKIIDALSKLLTTGGPVVTFGGESKMIGGQAQDTATKELRQYQAHVIAQFYGVPLPLLSWEMGQWSRGINEQLLRLAWRTCFKPHLDRLLEAMSLRLLSNGEKFHPDPTAFVRGDSAAAAEFINSLRGDAQRDPIASDRELRHAAGLPRDVDGEIQKTRIVKEGAGETGNPGAAA